MNFRNLLFTILLTTVAVAVHAQRKPLDRVIAVVGANITLQSELETQYLQMLAQGYEPNDDSRCIILEELLFGNLLLHQSKVDSLEVGESEVEDEMNRRLDYFIAQLGSQEKLEEYYEKSMLEIKDEFRELIENQLLTQRMQQKITADVKVTPAEVRNYFNGIPKDSLPYINAELELGRIMKRPEVTAEQKALSKAKAEELRQRVLGGEGFRALAILYSEDPGSSKKGGELGFFKRGQMVPEFDEFAFRLAEDSISPVFETQFGFHFMQMLERRGEQVNVRHILVKSKTSIEDMERARLLLDSIHVLIKEEKMTFAQAAEKFSDDEESRINGGMMYNPQTSSSKFEADQLGSIDPKLFLTVDKMEGGEVSRPVRSQSPDGKESYNLYFLKSRTTPHVANLQEDYQKIQAAALMNKQNTVIEQWINSKLDRTYVKVHDDFADCPFNHQWSRKKESDLD
ncbi:MAG: peptidylprolyl isomerase [Flavobacteriales bacterium]|nr:peptidylprolyl isomerase [Flavobacteriales bacterium]